MLSNFDAFLAKYEGGIIRLIVIVVILAVAWYGFLGLLEVPIDSASALIMVWLSVAVLIVTLFPSVMDRVKRVKIGDFEFELQEIVIEAKKKYFNPILEYGQDEMIFTEKGNLNSLESILRLSFSNPSRPILLVVNIYPGKVSLPVLFFYLYFLNLIGSDVIVLFISQQGRVTDLNQISATAFMGLISGAKVLHTFYGSFPESFKALQILPQERLNQEFDNYPGNPVPTSHFLSFSFDHFLNRFGYENRRRRADADIERFHEPNRYPLTENDVLSWFGHQLDTGRISQEFSKSDVKEFHEAIMRGDEYIVLTEENHLIAVLTVCGLSKRISIKSLDIMAQ